MPTDIVGRCQQAPTDLVVEWASRYVNSVAVFDTDSLLAELEARGVRNVDIAKALGLPDSRVPEIKKKARKLTLDEGAKLVEAFGLEQSPSATPLPPQMLRLVARHIVNVLGVPAQTEDPRVLELVADLQAFSRFVADPQVRESIAAAEAFFRAMQLRREDPEATRKQTDPRPVH